MNNSISRRTVLGLGATAAATAFLPLDAWAAAGKRRVVVWSEGTAPKDVYPHDINGAIADGLKKSLPDWDVVLAGIDDPDQGVGAASLAQTDVLMWWGHKRHREVKDEVVEAIFKRVNDDGMGFISLHSSHFSKPYKRLMGTACSWSEYKADGTSVSITVKEPNHPICQGVKDFDLPKIERYGEPFAVPEPEAVPLDGVYTKPDGTKAPGRMGLCWTIGKGRVFYFTPGHETYDDFFRPEVKLIMANAVKWAAGE
ncbi:MAG: ThuA domain-containing protein [Planctomycetes bacterium]|nr:ThuA domain-containing protein [Planctomycetota bacterium]